MKNLEDVVVLAGEQSEASLSMMARDQALMIKAQSQCFEEALAHRGVSLEEREVSDGVYKPDLRTVYERLDYETMLIQLLWEEWFMKGGR